VRGQIVHDHDGARPQLEQIRADPDLAQRFAILTSIPGVSAVTAFALLIEMPELGALEAAQAASLAGLAPVARRSGRWNGRALSQRPQLRDQPVS